MSPILKLYDSSSSNASFRARIILYLKGLHFERVEIDIVGSLKNQSFVELNNQGMVPILAHGDFVLSQSMAIAEYLEEIYPEPSLLPLDAHSRAQVRALALIIASDGQPIVNLRVRRFIEKDFSLPRSRMIEWMQHWLSNSLQEYEGAIRARRTVGAFSYGAVPTIADAFLVPHVLLSRRFGVDLAPYKEVCAVHEHCMELPAFKKASSEYLIKDIDYGI